MKNLFHRASMLIALGLYTVQLQAGDLTECDVIYNKVYAAVTAEPSRVLLVVEDAIITDEACACEIVKAAILASKANADLAHQIQLTAANAAPAKAKLIAECVTAIIPEAGDMVSQGDKDVVFSGKDVLPSLKEPSPVQPVLPAVDPGPSDYAIIPPDIRGVYLIQPAAGGLAFNTGTENVIIKKVPGETKTVIRYQTPTCSDPQSPSCSCIAKN